MTAPLNINRPRECGHMVYQRVEKIFSALQSERSRAALEYWLSKSGGTKIPGKKAMDPVDMAAFLPSIVLIDVIKGTQDFRFRLVGGSIRYHLPHDITGLLLSQTKGIVVGKRLERALTECTKQRLPSATTTLYRGPHANYTEIEVLMLPLTSDGHNVDHMLITMQFFQSPDAGYFNAPDWVRS